MVFLVRRNLSLGTRFTALQAEIIIPIRINNDIFAVVVFKTAENLIKSTLFLWLVKTK